jgi:NADH dehydrogenase/NADH:ubiquinone oxidoreductase subunit G
MPEGQFVRLAEQHRPAITLHLDGRPIRALAGDTVLTALLTAGPLVRRSEFGDGPRAGFCVMGACQDCWVFLEAGGRIRACTSMAADGMRLSLDGPSA